MTDPNSELDKKLILAWSHLMIGKPYPSIAELLDAARPLIARATREAYEGGYEDGKRDAKSEISKGQSPPAGS